MIKVKILKSTMLGQDSFACLSSPFLSNYTFPMTPVDPQHTNVLLPGSVKNHSRTVTVVLTMSKILS